MTEPINDDHARFLEAINDDRPPREESRKSLFFRSWILPLIIFGLLGWWAHEGQDLPPSQGCTAVEVGLSSGAYCPDQGTPNE
jgi:hypothetical protein